MNIFHIEAEQHFLTDFINGIKQRFLSSNSSEIRILLPSKRACIELERNFTNQNIRIHPKIFSISEIGTYLIKNKYRVKNKPLEPTEYKLLLTQELYKKYNNYHQSLSRTSDLYQIINKLEKDDINLSALQNINFGDISQHSQELINNLNYISTDWVKSLKIKNKISLNQLYNTHVDILIKQWKETPPQYPIIIAGSMGSVKSTTKLIKAIADLDNGSVILYGMDNNLSDSSWKYIDEYHPSFLLKKLIHSLGIKITNIKPWVKTLSIDKTKSLFMSEIMCPKEHSTSWHKINSETFNKLNGLTYVECKNLEEEAALILHKTRELRKSKNTKIGIITYDQMLVKRFKILTELHDIEINNSYNDNISHTQEGAFIKDLINAINERFSPITLISLFNNTLFNLDFENLKSDIYKLEKRYLRGVRKYKNLDSLIILLKEDPALQKIIKKLHNSCKESIEMFERKIFLFKECLLSILETLKSLSETSDILDVLLQDLIAVSHRICLVTPQEFLIILNQYLSDKSTSPKLKEKSNIYLLSPIESRLLNFDYLILAGINENIWPKNMSTPPWFNSMIGEELELTKPETQIGKSAYDFYCLMHHKKILITRSTTIDGKIQIASRWLTRLEAFAKKINKSYEIKPQNYPLLNKIREVYNINNLNSYKLPKPKPDIKIRPTEFSVTQIEQLIRDPYSIYASKILKLQKLEPIDKVPSQLEFGNLIHKVIHNYNKNYYTMTKDLRVSSIITYAETLLYNIKHIPVVSKMWIPRLKKIAEWLVEFEKTCRANNKTKIYSEIKGSISISTENGYFTLKAKADRIEITNKDANILDFKTGSLPTQKDIISGFSPQLSLEALIAKNKGFKLQDLNSNGLVYVQLATGTKLGNIDNIKTDIPKLIDDVENGLKKLLDAYMDKNTAYLICPHSSKSPKYNEYDNLERLEEFIT